MNSSREICSKVLKMTIKSKSSDYHYLHNNRIKKKYQRHGSKGIIVNLPKKGDLTECGNWRGIT